MPSRTSEFAAPAKRHEVLGVIFGLVALFLLLSLISYRGLDREGAPIVGDNLVGLAGTWTAYLSFSLLGASIYLIDIFLWVLCFDFFFGRRDNAQAQTVLGIIISGFLSSILLHNIFQGRIILGGHVLGGFLGELFGEILISVVSKAGTSIICIGGLAIIFLLVTDLSLAVVFRSVAICGVRFGRATFDFVVRVVKAWQEHSAETISSPDSSEKNSLLTKIGSVSPDEKRAAEETPATEPKIVTKKVQKRNLKKSETAGMGEAALELDQTAPKGTFQLPPLSLLADPPKEACASVVDEKHLKEVADHLIRILNDFGVYGEVREIHPGPVVTMFEFQPRSGTKLSKIENLSSELAMTLEVLRVRVVAPIPGKNAVGFELPNKTREIVYLKEILQDEGFAAKHLKLPLALGKDISGAPRFVDLARMPHLLIAGTTGSGKSVALNSMLVSLLYKYTPEDLRMLLVDPKVIELGTYDGIPHLLLPVVTDMSKACLALKWAVDEMERRYQIFADCSVKNLDSYNRKVSKILAEPAESRFCSSNGEPSGWDADPTATSRKLDKLPLIVIVIDELADLMMVAAKDVETSIVRLAQKARAAGIHLIVATQRPSVDVITGLIKANFPSKISFRVSSGTDSRVILGTPGAENLLGEGDMLVLPPGTSDLDRVHGAFIDEDETLRIVSYLKSQGAPTYDEKILIPREDDENGDISDDEKDEVYDQAVAIVAETQLCSISMLQRRLRIGYNRSARIVERMEKDKVVGPANGVNKRDVLISSHY